MRLFTASFLRLDVITDDFAAELTGKLATLEALVAEAEAKPTGVVPAYSSERTAALLRNVQTAVDQMVKRKCLAAFVSSTLKPRDYIDVLQMTDGGLQMGIIPRDEMSYRLSGVMMDVLTVSAYTSCDLTNLDRQLLEKLADETSTSATPLLTTLSQHLRVRPIEPLLAEKFRADGFMASMLKRFGDASGFDLNRLQSKVHEIACVQVMHIQQYEIFQPRMVAKQRRQQWQETSAINDLTKALFEFAQYKKPVADDTSVAFEEAPVDTVELTAKLLTSGLMKPEDTVDGVAFEAVYATYQVRLKELYLEHDQYVSGTIDLPMYDDLINYLNTEGVNKERLLVVTQSKNFSWQSDGLTRFVQESILREQSLATALQGMGFAVSADTVAKPHYSSYLESTMVDDVLEANQLAAARMRVLFDTFRLIPETVKSEDDMCKVGGLLVLLDEVFEKPLDKPTIHKLASVYMSMRYQYLAALSQRTDPMSDMIAVFACMQPLVMQLVNSVTLQTDRHLHALISNDFVDDLVTAAPFSGADGVAGPPTVPVVTPVGGPSLFGAGSGEADVTTADRVEPHVLAGTFTAS
ncbi:MAG: hypothetical protein P1U63_11720 [Coxiellaceae bacterium]|nr:hypothetical protein [Coxiellaceae bacterium]